jgi:hypothetical protein
MGKFVAGQSVNEPSLMAGWWVFATIASVVGLIAERATIAKSDVTPNSGIMK